MTTPSAPDTPPSPDTPPPALVEPEHTLGDPGELAARYLDAYRTAFLHKMDACARLGDGALRSSRVPSGWTPLQLLKHLRYVERRWLVWGFTAEPVDAPWGDAEPGTERWRVGPDETYAELRGALVGQGARSQEILAAAPSPAERAALGGRFGGPAEAPTLAWIVFHLVQEYARHLGHLDIVLELADGGTGE